MSSIRQQLLDMVLDPDDAYGRAPEELLPMQLKAAHELFLERRAQLPLLARRADDAGISAIHRLDDLIPLLFAHTVYKSYPTSLVEQGRWDRMLQWLDALSVPDVTQVDVSGVRDVDDWIARLWQHGHLVLATSGSSGKCSFLNHTVGDRELKQRHFRHTVGWPHVRASADRPVFWLGPLEGPNSAVEAGTFAASNWGRPGAVYAMRDQPLRIADISRMAAMRTKMRDGTATPQEILEMEDAARGKGAAARASLAKLADELLDHRHEPVYVSGMWAQHLAIIARARERGIGDGEFHPKSIVGAGGGVKSVALPPDYREQVARFYGDVVRPANYGMTEMAQVQPRCEAGRYHHAPGLIWLILDAAGERLLRPEDGEDGIACGRFAFVDLLYEGRWGGLISGDKVTVDYAPRCRCGRPGPTLLDDITRFAQAGEDDHIGCAGTIDAYVRGGLDT